jgi:hypothetical protein
MKQVVRETRTTAGIKISFKERINKTQLASLTNNA